MQGEGYRQVQYSTLGQHRHRLGVRAPELYSQLFKSSHPSADTPKTAPKQGEVKQLKTLAEPVSLLTAPYRQRRPAQTFKASRGTRYNTVLVTGT